MNILVTGGAGYIGSHTAKVLAQSGFQPVTLDNLCYGHEWAVQWGALEKGDLADSAFVRARDPQTQNPGGGPLRCVHLRR